MKFFLIISAFALFGFGILSFFGGPTIAMEKGADLMENKPQNQPVAVLAGGCFWCLESEFRALNGILFTRVGYAGGDLDNPTYRQITTGKTGHAEVVEITYDPEQLSYEDLLEFFLAKAHDPTQLNRQGVDVGTQYRSAIFYMDEAQKAAAEKIIAKVNADKVHKKKIVTTLEPFGEFWEGEEYHQQYYEKYKEQTGKEHIRVMMKKKKR